MALPTSGPLSLADIQTEFGGSNPIGLNEYYAGGSYVRVGQTSPVSGAIPSSGPISIANFYGTTVFTSGSATYNSGSGTFTVPQGTITLNIKVNGGGGAGGAGLATGVGGITVAGRSRGMPLQSSACTRGGRLFHCKDNSRAAPLRVQRFMAIPFTWVRK